MKIISTYFDLQDRNICSSSLEHLPHPDGFDFSKHEALANFISRAVEVFFKMFAEKNVNVNRV